MLGIPSLSAGAWYVAIDFQLYALLAIGAAALHRSAAQPVWRSPLPWAVAALTLASLAWFNRDGAFDAWAPYFFSAYGLGALAAWAGRSRALAGLFGLVCAAAPGRRGVANRGRAWRLACLTAIALATLAARWHARGRPARALAYWSDASYGVFLIHYAVIVATTALWLRLGLGGTRGRVEPAARLLGRQPGGRRGACSAVSARRCRALPWAGLRRVSAR